MPSKKEKQFENDSDLEANQSSDSDLDAASFITKSVDTQSTVSVKKLNLKKRQYIDDSSSSEDDDWKTNFTKSVRKDFEQRQQQFLLTKTNFKKKYPKQVKNFKSATVQVKQKDNSNSKYQDLCAICLDKFSNIRGNLGCGHKFCFQCIEEWIKTSTRCPCCREKFTEYVRVTVNQKNVEKKREIVEVQEKVMEFNELDYLVCYTCNRGDDEDVLLVCDMCQFYCCHVYCDQNLRNVFPDGDWYCKNCMQTLKISQVKTSKNTKAAKQGPKKQTKQAHNRKQAVFSESSSEDSNSDQNDNAQFLSRSVNDISVRLVTRSKAYEMINMRSRTTRSNFSDDMERIANSTATNLRNLRRRRVA